MRTDRLGYRENEPNGGTVLVAYDQGKRLNGYSLTVLETDIDESTELSTGFSRAEASRSVRGHTACSRCDVSIHAGDGDAGFDDRL